MNGYVSRATLNSAHSFTYLLWKNLALVTVKGFPVEIVLALNDVVLGQTETAVAV